MPLIREWLKSLGDLKKVPIETDLLDDDGVNEIERALTLWKKKTGYENYCRVMVRNLPRQVYF